MHPHKSRGPGGGGGNAEDPRFGRSGRRAAASLSPRARRQLLLCPGGTHVEQTFAFIDLSGFTTYTDTEGGTGPR